jgi:glycosyltransferase involved in cell wall biosynthesis
MRKEMKKLKIGVVVDQLLAGGVQQCAIEQVKHLRKLGHKAELLILMRKRYPTDFSYLVKNIPHQYLSDSYPLPFRQPIKFPIFSFLSTLHILSPFLASRIIKSGQYDILVSHGTTTCLTTQALWRRQRIPYIAVIHDPMVYILEKCYSHTFLRYFFFLLKPLARVFERSFVQEAAETIIVSRVHLAHIKKTYGVEAKVLTHGCKTLTKIPKKRGDCILSFGRWQKEKNPQFLLKLIKSIPSAKLIIAGSWTNQNDLKNFQKDISKQKLENRVKVISHFTNQELEKLCAQSRAWLHPHFEAFGLAALEAAGHGLPIIIPEKSGVTEIFKDGVHGFFPKKVELAEYKKFIEKLSKNEPLARKMGKAAWETVRKTYSWETNAQKLLEIIKNYQRQKRIVCLANAFVSTTSIGGGDRFLIELARRLPGNLHLTIILPSPGLTHYHRAKIKNPNIRYLLLPQNPFDNQERPIPIFLAYTIRSVQTYFLLRRLPSFQVLHTATDLIPDSFPAYFYHRHHKDISWVSRFFHFVEPPLKREGRLWVNTGSWILQQLSLKLLRQANLVMVDNPNLKGGLEKKGVAKDRIKLHSGGVDIKEITKAKPLPSHRSDAIFVGRLQPHKGVFDAIDVWQKVVKEAPKAKLIMVGYAPPEMAQKVIGKIKKTGLEKNIFLTGYIRERKKVLSYLRSSELLLFLDHEAGFGLVNAEAMAAGLPVVAYNLPLFGTTFHQGFLTAPLGETTTIASLVVNLLKNPKKLRSLSLKAKKEALKFDWPKASQKFYKDLLQLPGPENR